MNLSNLAEKVYKAKALWICQNCQILAEKVYKAKALWVCQNCQILAEKVYKAIYSLVNLSNFGWKSVQGYI